MFDLTKSKWGWSNSFFGGNFFNGYLLEIFCNQQGKEV